MAVDGCATQPTEGEGSNSDKDKITKTPSTSEVIAESLARITLGGFAGSLTGLGLEKRRQFQQQYAGPPASFNDIKQATSASNLRLPPRAAASMNRHPHQTNPGANLPYTWALSCMIFLTVLETFRVVSPTSRILESMESSVAPETSPSSFNDIARRTAIKSVGDYTLGGAVAGLAGGLSPRRIPMPSSGSSFRLAHRPLVIWSLLAGTGLGMIAGIFQAGAEVGDLYIRENHIAPDENVSGSEQ